MCGVLHRNLGKGARCALPLHPSGPGSFWALNPSRAIRTFRRSITRGRLRSPCTHRSFQEDQGLSRPLKPTRRTWRRASPPAPNHAQTTGRSISNQGSLRAPTDTPMRTSSKPLHGDGFIATRKGAFHSYPFLGTNPSSSSLRAPCNLDQ